MQDPYAEFREASTGDNLNGLLRSLVDDLLSAQREVAEIEQSLTVAKNKLRDIAENRIPTATDGMEGEFKIDDRTTLSVKEEIRASIAGDKRDPAIQWLDKNEYGHIVKRQVIVEFPRGSNVEEFLKKLDGLISGQPASVKTNFTVHPATLVSWVKEQLKEGVDLPSETFGIFRQRVAKVKVKDE